MIRTSGFGLFAVMVSGLLLSAGSGQAGPDPFVTIHEFTGPDINNDGEFPDSGLIADGNGNLFGTTFGALTDGAPAKRCAKSCGTVYEFSEDGTLSDPTTLIHSFSAGAKKDGAFPTSEPLLFDGAYYGTTEYGVKSGCGGLGCGTLYRIPANNLGKEKTFNFCLQVDCADGMLPHAGLTAGSDGNLYGTATLGGSGNGRLCGSAYGGCGVVYKLTKQGSVPIYSFCSSVVDNLCADGAVPYGGLVADASGNLYGTTEFGGANAAGTIFKIGQNGSETVLYSFCQSTACADGAMPQATMIIYNGDLYGTAAYGGSCGDSAGCGVVFKISENGSGFEVLYTFGSGTTDGVLPQAPLVSDGAGMLYGTTREGGDGICSRDHRHVGCGTLFQLGAGGGNYQVLHQFNLTKSSEDGAHPVGSLVLQGNTLFGATSDAGAPPCDCGTLYKYSLSTLRRRH
jgi:uncharacterized repeat protein (TIGR03803 family)